LCSAERLKAKKSGPFMDRSWFERPIDSLLIPGSGWMMAYADERSLFEFGFSRKAPQKTTLQT
jgi:hypothetical protein